MAKGKKGGARGADRTGSNGSGGSGGSGAASGGGVAVGSGAAAVATGAPTAFAGKELQEAIGVFAKGDYARARNLLRAKAEDPSLSDSAREHARALINATRIERGTLYVGLACIALFVLVLIVTSVLQPHGS